VLTYVDYEKDNFDTLQYRKELSQKEKKVNTFSLRKRGRN